MFSRNFKKSFIGNWNRTMEPGDDSFGRVSGYQAQYCIMSNSIRLSSALDIPWHGYV